MSAANGLRAQDIGTPDVLLMREHHDKYVQALKDAGAEVIILNELEEFPDGHFVEDSALCLQEGAIILRPGAPSRFAESQAMAKNLENIYKEVRYLSGSGFIEGGDILTTDLEILVGKSARTKSAGIQELASLVSDWGYKVREVATPKDVLHLKTACSLLDENTILSTTQLSSSGCFKNYKVIDVASGEEPAANCIRFNSKVFMPEEYPITAERVSQAGFDVQLLPNSECHKIDGGLSCLSLRFNPINRK